MQVYTVKTKVCAAHQNVSRRTPNTKVVCAWRHFGVLHTLLQCIGRLDCIMGEFVCTFVLGEERAHNDIITF